MWLKSDKIIRHFT